MSQETEKINNQANIDSSSSTSGQQEEKKYAFNQAEVNRAQNVNQNQNPYGQPMPNGQWQQGQPMPNGQWQQGQPGPNGQWQQGQPMPNGQWQQGQPRPNGQWQQGQPGSNGQWQQGQSNQNQQRNANSENQQNKPFQNPFKMFGEPVKVPKIKTNQDARNVYFGINQDYYNKVYKEYKEGKKISWNWSAFVFRSYWFFSRKMYTLGALYTVMMALISFSAVQIKDNLTNPQIVVMAFPLLVAFLAIWAAVGMFGNYMYMAHMENKIVYPSDKEGSAEQITKLNVMRGGFSINGIIIAFLATDLILTLVQYVATLL